MSTVEETSNAVPLRDMLRTLRLELQASMEESANQSLQFHIDKIDLELQIEVTNSGSAKAGVEFYVVSVGAKGERSSSSSHIFRLSLTPKSSKGEVLVNSKAPKGKLPR